MSDNWEAERQQQNDYLRRQMAALRSAGRGTWKRWRLLDVVCRGCGDTVVEVMKLDPYWVVRHWDYQVTKGDPPPATWEGQGWSVTEVQQAAYERAKADTSTRLTRRGEPMFYPVRPNWQASSNEILHTACRCRGHELKAKILSDAVAEGTRKITV
ncbi:MAG: hypothetical protein Q4F53_02430 [Nesterenkonia sp.]|nr:hypothetical protein [Nesterenkonia sp.]